MIIRSRRMQTIVPVAVCVMILAGRAVRGQVPALDTVFPAGAQAGQSIEVTVGGTNLPGATTLYSNAPGLRSTPAEANRFKLTIPAETPPGLYDLWAVGEQGISAPRTFSIGNRTERLESESNDTVPEAMAVPLDVVINGRAEKPGDTDCFRFEARQGQRVIVECSAERIDSRMRVMLEILDSNGRRQAVNRGYSGIDPLIDFRVPADGSYIVKVEDLLQATSPEHYYRLEIDTGPRVAFSMPNVIPRGKPARVTLYGWNLPGATSQPVVPASAATFDRVEVEIPDRLAHESWPLPVQLLPAQGVLDSFAYHLPGSHSSVLIGVTDSPVQLDREDNHSPSTAQEISVPCEVSGQLAAADECDWFVMKAQRGEVLHLEAFGQRIRSPVDLQISVLDASTPSASTTMGLRELAQFHDVAQDAGGPLHTSHLDPVGRWVCPADGRYLLAVRNLSGASYTDPRRTYRLSVSREVPDFHLVALPAHENPAGLNIPRGGREVLDVVAFRQRGFGGPIRVTAKDLPAGIECPDVWLGPGVDRATLVVSADREVPTAFGVLKLEGVGEAVDGVKGTASVETRRTVRGATVVRGGMPVAWGRLTSQIPFSVAGAAPLRMIADAHEALDHHLYGSLRVRHAPGGVLDVAVQIERLDSSHQAPVKLTGIGLPAAIRNQWAVIPAGEQKGYLSFYLPTTLPTGRYSLAVRAETTVPGGDKKTELVAVCSNSVTIDVQPAAFQVEVDPFVVTRVKRGETIQVPYTSKRLNGFIGKMHTELAMPGRITNVTGLRGRGETFVGQVDKGSLQIVVNDDAPLGQQPFLRLFTVGVVEDEPIYHGSSFLPLEIVE